MELLNTRQAAKQLGLSRRTLEGWRVRGGGPAYRKFGSAVRYDSRDLVSWAEAKRRESTSDQGEVAA